MGQPTTALVSISQVPLSAIPAALPDNFYPDTLISVTFSGDAKLTTAAAISAPNRAKYVPDTKLNLWKLDANTGEFAQVGKGVVSLDGTTIKTTTGGVLGDGIYTYLLSPVAVVADKDNPFSQPTTQLVDPASVPINSQANFINGSVTDNQTLVGYQSMGMNHTFTLHYNSQWADPTRFLNGQIQAFTPSDNYNRLVEKWVIRNGNTSQLIDGSNRDESQGIHGGEHFYALPKEPSATGKIVMTPFTSVDYFATQTSGIYELAHTVSLAKFEDNYLYGSGTTVGEEILNINRADNKYGNADFGAGWSLAGVQELLLTRNDGKSDLVYRERGNGKTPSIDNTASVAIVDGDGTTILYRPATTIFEPGTGIAKTLTYTSPAGDYSKFVKDLIEGTYTRTLKDGTIYKFDKWGQLEKIEDLNQNQTKFRYDSKGHLTDIIDPANQITHFTLDGNEQVIKMTAPGERITRFEYDNGNLRKIINPDEDNSTRSWNYVNNHHIHTFTDELGNKGIDDYDEYGRINHATQRDGNKVDIKIAFDKLKVFQPTDNTKTISLGGIPLEQAVAFTPNEFTAEVSNALNQKQYFTLNKTGQITKATDAAGGITTTAQTPDGLPTKTTDKYGNVTTYTYDERGNVTDIIYGDAATTNNTKRIFGDDLTSIALDPQNTTYGNVGKATQVAAYEVGGKSYAVVGTSKSWLEFVTTNDDPKNSAPKYISLKPLSQLVDNRYTSLQKLLISNDSNDKPWLYVGYDYHDINSFNPNFYLRDNRYSNADPDATGEVAKFAIGAAGTFIPYSKVPLGTSITGGQRYSFSVGDIDVGAVNAGKDDVVAINMINNGTRLGLAQEFTDGKLFHISPFDTTKGNSIVDTNAQPPTVIIQGIDYFTPGYKIAVLDDGIVATTVPGKNYIALFKKSALNPLILDWQELGRLNTPGDISALDTITIGGKKELVYVAGQHLYLQDPTTTTAAIDLGIVGTSQAIAVGNLHGKSNDPQDITQDIAVADYNQNLHVFILDATGKVIDSQTSKINTKPRDITIFDWNRDGYNDILIADGGSGLDIKLNQLTPVTPTTPPPLPLLDTKFEYKYADKTDRITQKTQIDIVKQGNGYTPDITRKTITIFDDVTGNLKSIKVIGSDKLTTAETSTEYNSNGTIKSITDAELHVTKYNYYQNETKQLESIERGYGTADSTSEHYKYDAAGNLTELKDGRGNITKYEYDPMNRQTKVIKTLVDPITSALTENITKTEYYLTGWVKSVTDANQHQTSYTYDKVGRIATQTAADGGKTEYNYDKKIHNLESIIDAAGRITSYEYYDNQQIKNVIDKTSAFNLATTTHYEYSTPASLDPKTVPFVEPNPTPTITTTVTVNGDTRKTVDTYDRYQRLIKSTNPIGIITSNEYNDDGTIKSSKIEGINSFGGTASHQTKYEYDELGRQNRVTDTLDRSSTMVYDLVGNVKSMTDFNGNVVDYKYDALNRKTQTITPITNYDLVTTAPSKVNLSTSYHYDKNGNIDTITDASGRVVKNQYDELNRRIASTNAFGTINAMTTKSAYDKVGNLTSVTDANNHTTTYEYDPVNRQNKVTNALGKVVSQKVYDKIGRVTSSTNPDGETTTSTYDNSSHMMRMTNSLGTSTQANDAYGNIVSTTDVVGRTNAYEYDNLNRRTKSTDYRGGIVSSSYDDFNNLITEQNASNNIISYKYDALNRRINTSDSLGQIAAVEYDNVGNKTKEFLTVDAGKVRETNYKYDELNRQYSMTTAVGTAAEATMRTSYDNVGNVIGTKDPLGRISRTSYDNLNRQTSVTQALGTVDETTSTYQYDKVGNRRFETNGRGYTTEYKYDELNRQTKVIDAYLDETKTEYFDTPGLVGGVLGELSVASGNVGKVVKTTDALNHATYTLYDKFARQIASYDATKHRTSASEYEAVDRLIKSTDTFGQNTSYTYQDGAKKKLTVDSFGGITTELYDVAGNLTDTIDSLNRTTHYDYDKRNRQTRITDASGGKTDYTYYQDGKTKSIKDAVGNVTGYIYDIAGRLVEEDSVLGSRFYGYDLVNNRIQGTDRNGRVIKYDYDNLNRVKSELWVGNGKSFIYTYDKNGNRLTASDGNIKYEYGYDHTDLLERVDRISGASPTVSFKYTYDEIGNLTQTDELVANTVMATTIYKYADPRYLNTEIIQTGVGLRSKDVRFTYDEAGLNTKIERYLDGLLKVTTTNAFDVHGRLTGIEQKNGGGVIGSDSYDLDILDRLTAQTSDGVGRTIGYDNTDQVKSVTGGNSEAYSYDLNGNRINGGYVTGSGNRLLSDGVYSYDYDAEGNRIKRTSISDNTVDNYTWDYRNRLVSVVSKNAGGAVIKTVGYEYDVDDQRVSKTVNTSATLSAGGVVENYYLDGNQIAFVTDGSGNQTFHYLYGLNVDAVMAQDSPSGMLWSLADRLGSIDTLTDAEGAVVDKRSFDSFGRVLSETNPSVSFRYGYTGRERDLESGLDYYRARYYDPNVGRFISVDPMGFGAGDTNLYRYVGNSSTLAIDPTGELIQIPLLGLAVGGAVLGGLFASAYGIADHFEHGGSISNIDWGDITQKGSIGAAAGATVATIGALTATGLLLAGVAESTVILGGQFIGAAGTAWQAGVGVYNATHGKPYTGFVDLVGAGLGVKGLVDGHQGYLQAVAKENAAAQAKVTRLDNLGSKLDDLAAETRSIIDGMEGLGSPGYQIGEMSKEGIRLPYNKFNNPTIKVYDPLANAKTPEAMNLILEGKLTGTSVSSNLEEVITMNRIRQQVAQGLGKNSNSDGIRTGEKRNISFSDVSITSAKTNTTQSYRIEGFSGTETLAGYTGYKPSVRQRRLEALEIQGIDRSQDPEAKMLESLIGRTSKNDTIHIILRTERPLCDSCLDVITQFIGIRPNTTIEVRGSVIRG